MVGLKCVIVAFPCYTHSLFDIVVAFISVFNSYEIIFMSVVYERQGHSNPDSHHRQTQQCSKKMTLVGPDMLMLWFIQTFYCRLPNNSEKLDENNSQTDGRYVRLWF